MESHKCNYPTEIESMKTIKKRWFQILIAFIGTIGIIVSGIIALGVREGTLTAEVKHLQEAERAYQHDSRNIQNHLNKISEATVRIEERLEGFDRRLIRIESKQNGSKK